MSLMPGVHLDLRISPRIFEKKNRNDPNVIFRSLGVDINKKSEAKNSRCTVPLTRRRSACKAVDMDPYTACTYSRASLK